MLLAHWALPDVRRFLFDGEALSAAEVTETIEESVRDFNEDGYGIWLIQETGPHWSARPGCGRSMTSGWRSSTAWLPARGERGTPPRPPAPWWSTPWPDLGLPEVLAEVDEDNAASVAVVKRLGMTPFAVVPGVLGPMTRYRKTAKPPMPTGPVLTAAGDRRLIMAAAARTPASPPGPDARPAAPPSRKAPA